MPEIAKAVREKGFEVSVSGCGLSAADVQAWEER